MLRVHLHAFPLLLPFSRQFLDKSSHLENQNLILAEVPEWECREQE